MTLENYLYSGLDHASPLSGGIIISEPIMGDNYFGRSVCLIIDKLPDNTHAGLILNKPLDLSLSSIIPDYELNRDVNIFCGGPVEPSRLTILHTVGPELGNCLEIKSGLYIGADLDKLIDYLENGKPVDGKIRLFLGYCGWGEDQLSNEIKRNSWAVNNDRDSQDLLSGEGLLYWQREVNKMGEDLKSWLNVAVNPICN